MSTPIQFKSPKTTEIGAVRQFTNTTKSAKKSPRKREEKEQFCPACGCGWFKSNYPTHIVRKGLDQGGCPECLSDDEVDDDE